MYPRIAFFFKDFYPFLIINFAIMLIFTFSVFRLLKSPYGLRTKKLLLALSFFIAISVLILSAAEGYFRYIYDESDGLGFLQVNKRWHQRHVVYNNYFKRDRDFNVEKPQGIIRIAVIGDSITFGQGIENTGDRFTNILENKLQINGINAEVYNLGVPGLDSHEEIKDFQNLSHLNFDVIVWQYYLNDIQPEDKGGPAKIISQDAYANDFVRWLTKNSTFSDFLYWRFSSKYSSTFDQLKTHYLEMYGNESILKSHEEEMANFISELKSEKKEIVVIIFPFTEFIGPNYPATGVHEMLKAYFASQEVETIDLLDYLKNTNRMDLVASKFDTHPNEKVHKLAAEKLYEVLSRNLK